MPEHAIMLKVLLREQHWQNYSTFCAEYDKAAAKGDSTLTGGYPSRAQLGRWLSGALKGLPYPDHCRVLEKMFPEWTVEQLFEAADAGEVAARQPGTRQAVEPSSPQRILEVIEDRLNEPQTENAEWGSSEPALVARGSLLAALNADRSEEGMNDDIAFRIAHRLLEMKQIRRLSDEEARQLAGLAGHVIEMSETLDIDIEKTGEAHLCYQFDLLNLSSKPLTRVVCELWFEVTNGLMAIAPTEDSSRRVAIQRIHDTSNLSKFAFQISPPLQPGEHAHVGYTCDGGRFAER